MFKMTLYGKTMTGNNEDAWRVNSRLWFEPAGNGTYGAAYVGHDNGFPQGGFNEAGLTYDGFTVPARALQAVTGKEQIKEPGAFLKSLMQHCRTIADVQSLADRYDRSIFRNGVFMFVDSSGRYLIMEADTLISGDDPTYVMSNFYPSTVTDMNAVPIGRYQRGRQFLHNRQDTTLTFCKDVMHAMHECRTRIGDGTTYTTVFDCQRKIIYLYFYHDYTVVRPYYLEKELQKGNHMITMPEVFPENQEYQRFLEFKTPFNSAVLMGSTWGIIGVLVLFTVYWLYYNVFRRRNRLAGYMIWLMAALNIGLGAYLFLLLQEQSVFYSDTPYYVEGKTVINVLSNTPLALLVLIIPVGVGNVQVVNTTAVSMWAKRFFTFNTIVYLIALLLFAYWGLLCIIQN
ncbi:C45 family peptidase [Chitinophaga rhizophila]|uniref:Uncharacterized protein n=1 Tax=Chitinophaga rhizophila TaxID=2866212 RepID=A0ABS7GDM4_9BACT|nr:hypothetical protein [Chitinophaga rhizophila]MBW8684613.1 hypothetical protein [Chitinophaga rhizophila]